MKNILSYSLLLCLLCSLLSSKDCIPTKIAKVDYQQIYNVIGYQKVQYLQMEPEIKVEITALKQRMNELLLQIVKEEEEEKIEELQRKHRVYQSKMTSIQSILSSGRSSDYRMVIKNYVIENYGKDFLVIIDSQLFRNSDNSIVITHGEAIDITKQVIEEMKEILP